MWRCVPSSPILKIGHWEIRRGEEWGAPNRKVVTELRHSHRLPSRHLKFHLKILWIKRKRVIKYIRLKLSVSLKCTILKAASSGGLGLGYFFLHDFSFPCGFYFCIYDSLSVWLQTSKYQQIWWTDTLTLTWVKSVSRINALTLAP